MIVLLAVAAVLWGWVFLPAIESVLGQAYNGHALAPLQALFDRVATDAYKTPLPVYVDKLELIYAWVKIPVAGGLLAGLAMVELARCRFPRAWMAFKRSLPVGMWGMAGAGAVLGLTNSIRVAAPLAGLLIDRGLASAGSGDGPGFPWVCTGCLPASPPT